MVRTMRRERDYLEEWHEQRAESDEEKCEETGSTTTHTSRWHTSPLFQLRFPFSLSLTIFLSFPCSLSIELANTAFRGK